MRVVILNNRYHVTGGPERYLFAIESELRARGHEVIPFTVRYAQNRETPWSRYFPPPPGGDDAVYFRDVKGPLAKARLFARSVYSGESRRCLDRLLADVSPDLVYVIIVANYLSPSVLLSCRDAAVPVVMRLSDFHLKAPCYTCFDGNAACELCVGGSRLHAVRKKCVQGSRLVSLARVAGMAMHDRLGLYDVVDRFVAPSGFLRERMIGAGMAPSRIVHVPSFVSPGEAQVIAGETDGPGDGVLYVGRLDPEKGVGHLLEAWRRMERKSTLTIVGSTDTPEAARLRELVSSQGIERVEFAGAHTKDEVARRMRRARVVVVPSICYENLPLVAIEAMSHGKPIVAHRLGSLPEVVEHGRTGYLCDPARPAELAERLSTLLDDDDLARRMGHAAREDAATRFRPDTHVERLLEIFDQLAPRPASSGRDEGKEPIDEPEAHAV